MPSTAPTQEEWQQYKPVLRELWENKELTVVDIAKQMQERYGFEANKNAYDRQFRRWGWRKNLTVAETYAVGRMIKKRKLDNKESEVLLDGAIIHVDRRMKHQRLSYLDEIKLQNDTFVLPPSIIVKTPPPIFEELILNIRISDLPWPLFLKSAKERILQLDPTHTRALQFCAKSTDVVSSTNPCSMLDLGIVAGYLASLSESDRFAEDLLSLAYRLANDPYSIKKGTISEMFSKLRSLGTKQVGKILRAVVSFEGTLITSLLLGLLKEIFESELSGADNTQLAEVLLPRVKGLINSPVHVSSFTRPVMLADCLWSAPMARLFAAYGGDLTLAHRPLRRLFEQGQLRIAIDFYEVFGEAGHPGLMHWVSLLMMEGGICLMKTALEKHPDADLTLGLAFAFEHDDWGAQQAIFQHLTSQCLELQLERALAFACQYGFVNSVRKLISMRVYLDTSVQLPYKPGGVFDADWTPKDKYEYEYDVPETSTATALQFAIDQKHFGIASQLIKAGASTISPSNSNLSSPLRLALGAENSGLARELLAHDAFFDKRNFLHGLEAVSHPWCKLPGFVSLIILAVRSEDIDLVEELLDIGADPNERLAPPKFSLDTAIKVALERDREDVALLLYNRGALLTTPFCQETHDVSHKLISISGLAARTELSLEFVHSLNMTDTDLNALHCLGHYSDYGDSAIYHVCSPLIHAMGIEDEDHHNHDLMRYLISLGADVNDRNRLAYEDSIVTRFRHMRTTIGEVPFELALRRGCAECLDILLEDADDTQEQIVFAAARYERYDLLLSTLFTPYSGYQIRTDSKITELLNQRPVDHTLARAALLGAALRWEKDGDSVLFFQFLKVNTDYTATCMTTVVQQLCGAYTAQYEQFRAIESLLSYGVPLLEYDHQVPVSLCCGLPKRPPRGDFGYINQHTFTTAFQYNLATLLFHHASGAVRQNILAGAAAYGTVDHMRQIIAAGGDIHKPLNNGMPILAAAMFGNDRLEMVRYLLGEINATSSLSVPVMGPLDSKSSVLMTAAMWGNVEIAQELIRAGADVNAENKGWTALVFAANNGRLDMVAYLIHEGADISDSPLGQRQFKQACFRAERKGHPVIVQLLKDERRRMHGI